jgi:N-acetylneuraminic acid mutarotase
MPEITDLLESTTPTSVPHVDVSVLASLGRRRRRRQRIAMVAPVVAALVAIGAVVATAPSDDATPRTERAGPADIDLTEPVGAWKQTADPSLEVRISELFSGTLSDGRVVVWGGSTEDTDLASDGAVYDPATDRWEEIPAAPVESDSGRMAAARLSQDRLAVVTSAPGYEDASAAVYDFAERQWTAAPVPTELATYFDGIVWDGTTLALVRVDGGLQFDAAATRIAEPVTLRWTVGADRWQLGAPAPLSLRFGVGVADDNGRLALWGGSTEWASSARVRPITPYADGAIYDLAEDTWTPLPDAPLQARLQPSVSWHDGLLLVGGGITRIDNPGPALRDMSWYDPAINTWTPAEPTPSGVVTRNGFVLAGLDDDDAQRGKWFLGPDGWELAPTGDLYMVADLAVATSQSIGNPGDGRFEVGVRADDGQWLTTAEAPFTNRMDAAVVATGTKLVVFGGMEGSDLVPKADAWVFDLAG